MTSVIIPDFIFQLFEKEITKINLMVVEAVCSRYNLNIEEVKTLLETDLKMNFKLLSQDIEQVKIIKKHISGASTSKAKTETTEKIKPVEIETKNKNPKDGQTTFCNARVFISNELIVKQCSKSNISGCQFCKLHQRQHDEGKLKYGTINDKKPDAISTPALRLRVKRTIY